MRSGNGGCLGGDCGGTSLSPASSSGGHASSPTSEPASTGHSKKLSAFDKRVGKEDIFVVDCGRGVVESLVLLELA